MIARQFDQVCYIVDDLESAIATWRRMTGIGPWFILPRVIPDVGIYRGQPVEVDFSCAFAQAGPVQIEFIEQHNDAPSVYRDVLPKGQKGIVYHHLCYFADSLADEIAFHEGQGIETGFHGRFGAVKYAYFDTRAQLGGFTEVLEREEGVLGLFQMIADAAVDWDGSDPIRTVG